MRKRRCSRCHSPRPSRSGQFASERTGRSGFNRHAAPVFPPGLELLKLNLLHRALRTFCEAYFESPLRRSAEQAARQAMATGYPMLVFPELFAELAIPAMLESECQHHIIRRCFA